MGPVNWDYSKSWGSMSGLISGALAALLAANVLPDHPSVSAKSITTLALFFGALIATAPLVYAATQRVVDLRPSRPSQELQLQGYVGAFIIASVLTLAGVVGEGWALWQLLSEVGGGGAMPLAIVVLMQAALGLGGFLLIWYAWRTVRGILTYQCDTDGLKERQRRRARAPGEVGELPQRPSWSVL
jgi:hypothetical protein